MMSYTIQEYFNYIEVKSNELKDQLGQDLGIGNIAMVAGEPVKIQIMWDRVYFSNIIDSHYDVWISNTHNKNWLNIIKEYMIELNTNYAKYGYNYEASKYLAYKEAREM